jgi:hypothetical protein
MSEQTRIPVSGLGISADASGDSVAGRIEPPINPLPVQFEQSPDKSEDFKSRVKSFEPAAGALVNLVVAFPSEYCRKRLARIVGDERADEIVAEIRISDDARIATRQAVARIFARRCESSEAIDWTIVCGALAELYFGFNSVLREINKLEKSYRPNDKPVDNRDVAES